jgi:hypothetical protein
VLTLVVNTLVGIALEAILHGPPEKYDLGSAVLTVVSIMLIALAMLVGDRVFRQRLRSPRFNRSSLFVSTALFLVVVLVFVLPQLSEVVTQYASHTQYFYHHSSELLLMLSLPVARLVVLPTFYYLLGRTVFHGTQSI